MYGNFITLGKKLQRCENSIKNKNEKLDSAINFRFVKSLEVIYRSHVVQLLSNEVSCNIRAFA